MPNQIELKH